MYLSCKTNICPLRNDWLDEQSLCKIRENLFWHYVKKLCYHPLLWLATNAMIITFSHFSSWYVERLPSLFSQLILSNIIISPKKGKSWPCFSLSTKDVFCGFLVFLGKLFYTSGRYCLYWLASKTNTQLHGRHNITFLN